MTTSDFVKAFYLERQSKIDLYMSSEIKTEVSRLIQLLDLDKKGHERLHQVLSTVLTDTYYGTLLALDGEANIGAVQQTYKLFDQDDIEITGNGSIERSAYDYFHDNKFEIDKGQCDFIAILTFLSSDVSGRNAPAFSGYRPTIKFDFSDFQTSGQQLYIDRNAVFPGDIVEAEIKIVSVEHFEGRLKNKMKFDFREGPHIIGTGIIKHIVNPKLNYTSR